MTSPGGVIPPASPAGLAFGKAMKKAAMPPTRARHNCWNCGCFVMGSEDRYTCGHCDCMWYGHAPLTTNFKLDSVFYIGRVLWYADHGKEHLPSPDCTYSGDEWKQPYHQPIEGHTTPDAMADILLNTQARVAASCVPAPQTSVAYGMHGAAS